MPALDNRKCSTLHQLKSCHPIYYTTVWGCLNPVISTGCSRVDIDASANLEVLDKFCYLGDMLSVDGDADAAVETTIWIGWNKFRQLVPLLTNRDMSLIRRGRLYSSCVRSSMLHRSDTCLSAKNMRFHFSEQRWKWSDGCVVVRWKTEFQVRSWEKD